MNDTDGGDDMVFDDDHLPGLVDALLREQRMVVIEESEQSPRPVPRPVRRDLIPDRRPVKGEQYAFDVDLDACSGCGACAVACHNEHGLEPDERWRHLGMLTGGNNAAAPVRQHVTTACHHCVEPACLHGCPASAYEKHPNTGVVVHLDDRCIGCQYCTLTCPYDIPVYVPSQGIVRKCDMCHARLASDEAPACVNACPHGAIRIRIVDTNDVARAAEVHTMLPGAPDPKQTLPTTSFHSMRSWPADTTSADFFSVCRTDGHLTLVAMLVLTQMSVGGFVSEFILYRLAGAIDPHVLPAVRSVHLVASLLLGLTGMGAALFHLGRPERAYRAVLGWRRSWLSREIIAFALFAGVSLLYVAAACVRPSTGDVTVPIEAVLGSAAALAGVMAVFSSAMIYIATGRPRWRPVRTLTDFFLTAIVLGVPLTLLTSVAGAVHAGISLENVTGGYGNSLAKLLVVGSTARLLLEAAVFRHRSSRWFSPDRRAAMLLTGELDMLTLHRFFLGILGGIVLPIVLLAQGLVSTTGYDQLFVGAAAVLSLALLTAGEAIARYLFFAVSVAPRMPGVLS